MVRWTIGGARWRGAGWLALAMLAFGCSDGTPIEPSYGATDGVHCTPGDTRCHGDLGFQQCTPDGLWGESSSCAGYSDNGTSSYCALVTSGKQRWAACVDPACWWWLRRGSLESSEPSGVCLPDGGFRACEASGVLAPSAQCPGTCQAVGSIEGRTLGYCSARCQDGDRECVAGPLYRECAAGHWSEPLVCDESAECQPLAAGAALGIACGGLCHEGTSRCASDRSGVETCGAEGMWSEASACALGTCTQSGAQAQCQTECRAGAHSCAFDGDTVSRTCSEAGVWLPPSACEGESRCRLAQHGALGCVDCIGPGATDGGNPWGTADSRCTDAGVTTCGADGQLGPAVPCPDGKACIEQQRAAATLAYCH